MPGIRRHKKRFYKKSKSSNAIVPRSVFKLNSVIGIKTSYDDVQLVQASGVDTFRGYYVNLNACSNDTAYKNAFDQYKIWMVKTEFMPMCNSVVLGTLAQTNAGELVTAVDLDDNTSTVGSVLRSYNNAKVSSPYKKHVHKYKPRIAIAAYSGTFTSYANQSSWIDTASDQVQHYGVKAVLTDSTGGGLTATTEIAAYKVRHTLWILFRNTK